MKDTREKILNYLETHGASSGSAVADFLGVTRQAVNKHLRELVSRGVLVKTGNTRGAVYARPQEGKIPREELGEQNQEYRRTFDERFPLVGLEEHKVFEEIALRMNLRREMNTQAFEIFQYALTEMVNNAIDHSGGDMCRVIVDRGPYDILFSVRDNGVGLFSRIRESYRLKDEYEALGELIKGKRTTMPERHSGEGLYFTSKAGDEVVLKSHRIIVNFLNTREDLHVGEIPFLKGTQVDFSLKKGSRRQLADLFNQYAPEEYDYQFSRSRVNLKLFQRNYMSRSEARRLTAGLNLFKEVVLDFSGVFSVGQAFCDEIFRIYQGSHENIRLTVRNANEAVKQMIRHSGGIVD